jgi:O-antigen/teichoic acid export membrane protein
VSAPRSLKRKAAPAEAATVAREQSTDGVRMSLSLFSRLRSEFNDLAGTGFLFGLSASLATRAWLMFIGIVTSVVVTRALGPEGRGYFAVALTLSTIGSQIGLLGFNSANIWAVSRDHKLLGSLVGNSLAVSFVVGGLGAAAAMAMAFAVPSFALVPLGLLALALISIPISIAISLLNNLLIGIDRIRAYNSMLLLHRMGTTVLSIGLVLMGVATVYSLFFVIVVVGAAAVLVATCALARQSSAPIRVRLSVLRAHARYGARAYIVSMLVFLLLRVDILVIQAMIGPSQTGFYAVAVTVIDTMRVVSAVSSTLLMARLSREMDGPRRWRTAKIASGATAALMAVAALVAAFLAEPAIVLLYGDDFRASVTPFLLLLPGLLFASVSGVLVGYLGAVGMPSGTVLAPAVALIANVVLNLWWIPFAGIEGSAAASSIAYGVMLVIILAYARSHRSDGSSDDGHGAVEPTSTGA